MEFLKPVEIGFRRFLLRVLGFFVKRGRPLPPGIDFSSKKYLFVRQDRIGDVLVSTPLIHALKQRYPNATVDFLLSTNNHFVLENEPLVRKRWIYRKTLVGAWQVLKGVRREQYDFVIDLMDNPSATSTVLCALAGGGWNVGLSKINEYAYDIVVPLISRKEHHIIDRLAKLLTVFGIDQEGLDFKVHYTVARESSGFADRFIADSHLETKRIIGVNISPGEGTRFWGIENYRALISWLQTVLTNDPIVVLYQPSDQGVAEEIAKPFSEVLLSPETKTFDQFAALVERLWMLVTPDTSAVHLAAAFSIPSVVLYVQSDKELRIWEPYGSLSEVVVTEVDNLQSITLESVTRAITNLVPSIASAPSTKNQTAAPTR